MVHKHLSKGLFGEVLSNEPDKLARHQEPIYTYYNPYLQGSRGVRSKLKFRHFSKIVGEREEVLGTINRGTVNRGFTLSLTLSYI